MTIAQIMFKKLIERVIHDTGLNTIDMDMLTKYSSKIRDGIVKELSNKHSECFKAIVASVARDIKEKNDYFNIIKGDRAFEKLAREIEPYQTIKRFLSRVATCPELEFWDAYNDLISDIAYKSQVARDTVKCVDSRVSEVWSYNLNRVFDMQPGDELKEFSCLAMATGKLSCRHFYGDSRCATYSTSLITEESRKVFQNRRVGFLFDYNALDHAIAYSKTDMYTYDPVLHGDLMSVEAITQALLSLLYNPALLYEVDIDYINYMPMDYVCSYKPLYSAFVDTCNHYEVNEILLRKPVDPAGVFIIGDLAVSYLDDHTEAVAKSIEIPAFCIDLTGRGIRRLL